MKVAKQSVVFHCLWLVVVVLTMALLRSDAAGQSKISPVGCFQNLQEVHGDIFGFGVIKISKKNGGGYRGTFAERRTELGEHYDPTPLRNLRYDPNSKVLIFDMTFNDPILTRRNTRATVSRKGILVDVGKKMRAEYKGPNPLFRRKYEDCF